MFKIFRPNLNLEWHLLALHLIYFLLLLMVYMIYVVDFYDYMGFTNALNIGKVILAPFTIIASFALLCNNGLPSYFFLNIIIALIVTPSLIIFSGSDLPFSFIAITWFAFAILAIVSRFCRLPRIQTVQIDGIQLLYSFATLSLLFIVCIFAMGGATYINFDLSRVYEFRQAAEDNMLGIFSYLLPNFAKAIVPVGMALSLFYRKWLLLVVFIFCSVMIFALSSHKAPLFMPFIIIFVYWLSHYKEVTSLYLLALIIFVIIGGFDFYLLQSGIGGIVGWFGSLGIRRMLLVPSFLNWNYYDFFSVNPYDYWSRSKLTIGFVVSPYEDNIADLIGSAMFEKDMHANTGWIGSGMANAGYFGIALYSLLFGLFISLIDTYAQKVGYSLVTSAFLVVVLTAALSADFTSMLLTHGLLLLLCILILLKPYNRQLQLNQ